MQQSQQTMFDQVTKHRSDEQKTLREFEHTLAITEKFLVAIRQLQTELSHPGAEIDHLVRKCFRYAVEMNESKTMQSADERVKFFARAAIEFIGDMAQTDEGINEAYAIKQLQNIERAFTGFKQDMAEIVQIEKLKAARWSN